MNCERAVAGARSDAANPCRARPSSPRAPRFLNFFSFAFWPTPLQALQCAGVRHGDEVFTNGFTFTALPSTIIHAGARPVLVEANPNYTMNVADLEAKFKAHPNCA